MTATATRQRVTLANETDLAGWRTAARAAIAAQLPPEALLWETALNKSACSLLFDDAEDFVPSDDTPPLRILRDFAKLLDTALLHRNADRFAIAYRLMWRMQQIPNLHRNPADADVIRLNGYAKAVRRDIHKMHAFVRFRKVGEANAREKFVAWFEPDHHITHAVAPFFRNRFTGMDLLIVTPEARIGWDGTNITFGPGGKKSDVPGDDAVEDEWRRYYASIFNPARVKVAAMKSEMPVKYWRNLPEASLISNLIEQAGTRVEAMIAEQSDMFAGMAEPSVDRHDEPGSLEELYVLLRSEDTAPAPEFSHKLVVGEGPSDAAIMFVGEQPGDVEDEIGRPFVGPAGQLLDRALAAANIQRDRAFLTNAVKRFKYIQRGKRRLHQTPTGSEIEHYRWWLDQERRIIAPRLTVALGASAARAIFGKPVTISRVRGQILPADARGPVLVTVHPSYLLRLPDAAGREIEYAKFVRDLVTAQLYYGSGQ